MIGGFWLSNLIFRENSTVGFFRRFPRNNYRFPHVILRGHCISCEMISWNIPLIAMTRVSAYAWVLKPVSFIFAKRLSTARDSFCEHYLNDTATFCLPSIFCCLIAPSRSTTLSSCSACVQPFRAMRLPYCLENFFWIDRPKQRYFFPLNWRSMWSFLCQFFLSDEHTQIYIIIVSCTRK